MLPTIFQNFWSEISFRFFYICFSFFLCLGACFFKHQGYLMFILGPINVKTLFSSWDLIYYSPFQGVISICVLSFVISFIFIFPQVFIHILLFFYSCFFRHEQVFFGWFLISFYFFISFFQYFLFSFLLPKTWFFFEYFREIFSKALFYIEYTPSFLSYVDVCVSFVFFVNIILCLFFFCFLLFFYNFFYFFIFLKFKNFFYFIFFVLVSVVCPPDVISQFFGIFLCLIWVEFFVLFFCFFVGFRL